MQCKRMCACPNCHQMVPSWWDFDISKPEDFPFDWKNPSTEFVTSAYAAHGLSAVKSAVSVQSEMQCIVSKALFLLNFIPPVIVAPIPFLAQINHSYLDIL